MRLDLPLCCSIGQLLNSPVASVSHLEFKRARPFKGQSSTTLFPSHTSLVAQIRGEIVTGEVEILSELDTKASLYLMLNHFLPPDQSRLLAGSGLRASWLLITISISHLLSILFILSLVQLHHQLSEWCVGLPLE